MKIVIAGAGEVGTHLAKMLSQENQDIILMDPNEERLNFSKSSMEILALRALKHRPNGRRLCESRVTTGQNS